MTSQPLTRTAIHPIAVLVRAAETALGVSVDDREELRSRLSNLEVLVRDDAEDIQHLHRRSARETVALAEQLLRRADVTRAAAEAERAAPGATQRLVAHYDGLIAAARAAL